MRVVIDKTATTLRGINRIAQKQQGIYNCRNRNKEYIYRDPWLQQNECKQNGANCARCPQTSIIIVVSVLKIAGQNRNN